MKFANAYKQWAVEVSEQGNARVFTADNQPILVVRGRGPMTEAEQHAFGREILRSLNTDGLVATAKKMKAIVTPKVAQVVDGAIDDMKEFADKYMHDSVLEDADSDMQDDRESPSDDVTSDGEDDMDGDVRGTPPDSTQDDGLVDHSEGKPEGVDSATQEDNTDMAEKREKPNLGTDSVLDDEIHDHKEKLAALSRVGAKIVHKDRDAIAWTVRLASINAQGEVEVTVAADGQKPRRLAQRDLLEYWKSIDKPSSKTTAPSAPAIRWSAQQIQALRSAGVACEIVDGNLVVKTAKAAADEADKKTAMFEARMKKAWAAKEAKVKKEAEKTAETAKRASIGSFCRAQRIVASRQAANLEASPIKQAAEQLLASSRQIGVDANGAAINYPGMDPELARYLVAEIYQAGHAQHLETLMSRAAELMSKGDQYLLDAEGDAENFRPALPPISAATIGGVSDAEWMQREAAYGNFAISPQPPIETVAPNGGFDKRSAIRGAVQGTLVGSTLNRLRANN